MNSQQLNHPVDCAHCTALTPRRSNGPVRFSVPVSDQPGCDGFVLTLSADFDANGSRKISLVEVKSSDGNNLPQPSALEERVKDIVQEINSRSRCGASPQCPAALIKKAKEKNFAMTSIRCYLKQVPYFGDLTDDELDRLAQRCRARNLARQESLFLDGTPCRAMYILLRGHLKVYRTSYEGRQFSLHAVGPGETLEEEAALGNQNHFGTAEAITECSVLQIDAQTFREIVQANFHFMKKILRTVVDKSIKLRRSLSSMATSDSTSRIARFLDDESKTQNQNPVHLRLPKFEIASVIGLAPETLSRGLRRLQTDGVIEVKGLHIRILDRTALHELALCS